MQDGTVTAQPLENKKRLPPLRGFDPAQIEFQSILEQQIIDNDAFLQNFKTPTDIEEYHNFLRGNVFQESLGVNPYTITGEFKAVFNVEQELLKPLENGELTPEQSAMRDMLNRLVTFKGRIPEPAFLSKIISQSMTNGWARLLGADLVGLTRGFGVTEEGIIYKGKKLKLKPEQSRMLSGYINRISGAEENKDFFDTFVETAASLTFDLPLLYLTGGIAGGILKTGSVTSALLKSSSLMSRFLGNALQQSINFNILGMPQTVEFASDRGISGVLDGIYHSTSLGLLAATTGTLGAGIGRTAKFIPVAKEIANRNPVLVEEIASLGGSFGFGFASVKIAGGSDKDAIATGLAFAATHFTNPNAYKRVIREQINKDVLIRTTSYDGKDLPTKYHPDYFIEKDNKAFIINTDRFINKGEIVQVGKEGIELTSGNKDLYPYYNTYMGHYKTTFNEALIRERAERRSKDIYNDMIKDLSKDYLRKNKDMIRAFSRIVSQGIIGDKLGKVFTKWQLIDAVELSDKMVQVSNEFSMPYADVKKFVVTNLPEYMANPDAFIAKFKEVDLPKDIKTSLEKTLDVATETVIKKSYSSIPIILVGQISIVARSGEVVDSKGRPLRTTEAAGLTDAEVKRFGTEEFIKAKKFDKYEILGKEVDVEKVGDKVRIRGTDIEFTPDKEKFIIEKQAAKIKKDDVVSFEFEGDIVKGRIIAFTNEFKNVDVALERTSEVVNISVDKLIGEKSAKEVSELREAGKETKSIETEGEKGESLRSVRKVDRAETTQEKIVKPAEETKISEEKPVIAPKLPSTGKEEKVIVEPSKVEKVSLPQSSKEIISKSEEIDTLVENILADKIYFQKSEAKEQINRAFDEVELIAKELDLPVNDIMGLLLRKTIVGNAGLTNKQINAILRLGNRARGNKEISNIIRKYNPKDTSGKFNQGAFDKIKNSDILKRAKQTVEEKKVVEIDEELEEPKTEEIDLGGKEPPKATVGVKVKPEKIEKPVTDFESGLSKIQPIKDAEKRIEQVRQMVDNIVGDRELTEENFENIQKEVAENKDIQRLTLSNFDANFVAQQILENKLIPGEKDKPIELFRKEILGKEKLPASVPEQEEMLVKLNKELVPLGVKAEIDFLEQPEGKVARGVTLISDKGIKIKLDRRYADKNTFNEEKFHAVVQLIDNQNQVNTLLERYGWDGKARNKSWVDANEVLYDKYLAYTEGKIVKNTLFQRLKTLLKKVAAWFKGNKQYDEFKFFEDYANGDLKLITTKERYERIAADKLATTDIVRLNSMMRDEPRSDRYEHETLRALAKTDENLRKDLPRIVQTQAFLNNLGSISLGKAMRYWRFMQPPVFERYKGNWSAKFIEIGEKKLVRKAVQEYHKIMRTKWRDGEFFQGLPKDISENFVGGIKMGYTRDVYDGKTEVLSKEDFYKKYKVGESQRKIHDMYTDATEAGIEVAEKGLVDRLMFFAEAKIEKGETRINLADGLSEEKLAELFPGLDKAEIDEILVTDINSRLKVAEEVSKQAYDFSKIIRDDKGKKIGSFKPVYFDDSRPAHPRNWVIDATRPSDNENHKPDFKKDKKGKFILDEEGKKIITGYLEEVSGYVDGVHSFRTKASAEAEAKRMVADLKGQGYTEINSYRIGDILVQSEFWNKLTPVQLRNLASAGHISLSNEIVQKLLRAIKSGTFVQHSINKRYVPGMKGTMEEYERGLNNFVREAVNSNYRQNAILEMNKLREEEYLPDINEKLSDINLSAKEKEEIITERDYINAYINNITFSDYSFIDGYRGAVSTIYTALKASFLFQQAMQPVQTTLPGLISEYKKFGFEGATKTFWNAYKDSINLLIYIRALQKKEKPPESLNISKEVEELYFFLDDANKLGKVGIEELTTQIGDLDYTYLRGFRKFTETGKKYMNALSASVEKYTRLQGMMSFYKLGKLRGLKGEELGNYVADMIDEHLSEWGAPGRAPLFSSKISGKKQASIVKAFDKSFFVFKTFATHNLGLYEKLFREKSWKALGIKVTVGAGLHGLTKFPFMASIFLLADMFTENDTEYEVNNLIGLLDEEIGGKVGTILSKGIPASFGVNITSLFGEQSIFVGDILGESRARSVEGKIAEIMLGAPYGYGKDAIKAALTIKNVILDSIENNGALSVEYRSMAIKNISKLFPLFIRNVLIADQYGDFGLKTGEQVLIKPEDMEWYDIFEKMIGFQPLKVLDTYEEHFVGLPAKYSRLNGRIIELKKIRRSIVRAGKNIYNDIQKKNELLVLAKLLREAQREKAEFLRKPEVRQAIRERKFRP